MTIFNIKQIVLNNISKNNSLYLHYWRWFGAIRDFLQETFSGRKHLREKENLKTAYNSLRNSCSSIFPIFDGK